MTTLTPEETQRYKRHLVLREVGGQGQQKLKAARVIGHGGGHPCGGSSAGRCALVRSCHC